MIATIFLLTLLGAYAQDDKSAELRSWIESLRSERIEEREHAAREIRSLGKSALSELEKVVSDKDLEVAARARTLMRLIRLKEVFGIDIKDFSELTAVALVEWMEKKTGRPFVYTENLGLRNIRIRFPENLSETDDPYSLGVDLLRLANIGVAPSDGAPGALELFPAAIGSKKGLRAYKSVEELPKANEMCTLVLHPRYVSPRSVQAILINIITFPQNCVCLEESGTLLLSDYTAVLRKCAGILNDLDVARSFRVSVALLEGRSGKEDSIPEPFRNLRLPEATGLNHFTPLGTTSLGLQRAVQSPPGGPAQAGRIALRFPATPAYLVEFDGLIRAAGGPTLDRLTLRTDQEQPVHLFEGKCSLKDENWTFAGAVSTGEGASLVILLRAVAE
jgi:hypothetical protein